MARVALAWVGVVVAAAVAGATPKPKAPPPLPISGEWLWGTGVLTRRGPYRASSECGSYPATVRIVEHDGAVESDWFDARPMAGGAAHAVPPWSESTTEHLRGRFDGERLALDGSHDVVHTVLRRRDPATDDEVGNVNVRPPPDVHQPIHVELRFDERSGHLVGTHNGVAVWLARGTITPRAVGGCPP